MWARISPVGWCPSAYTMPRIKRKSLRGNNPKTDFIILMQPYRYCSMTLCTLSPWTRPKTSSTCCSPAPRGSRSLNSPNNPCNPIDSLQQHRSNLTLMTLTWKQAHSDDSNHMEASSLCEQKIICWQYLFNNKKMLFIDAFSKQLLLDNNHRLTANYCQRIIITV